MHIMGHANAHEYGCSPALTEYEHALLFSLLTQPVLEALLGAPLREVSGDAGVCQSACMILTVMC